MRDSMIRYQSANLSIKESIDSFIVRKEILEKIISNIDKTQKGDSLQHYVFIGRRGSGKSTLLRRIEAEICTKEKLSKRFIVVNLSEEQAGIYKLYDLWDQVITALNAKDFSIEKLDWKNYQDNLKEYTKQLYSQIHTYLNNKDKQLILLIDNIDRIFKSIGEDAHLFREFLMNFNEVRIIGGSTIMAEEFWSYDKPFYQFFSTIPLKSLSNDEVKKLLEFWATKKNNPEISNFIENHPGKLQTIRMLTDGTPRTMLLFVELLINRPEQNGFEYLRSILDKATPIYQERLATLSPLQQKIVLELSFFWESVKVDELVPACKMQSKTISAVLNQLTKLRIVEKIKGENKNLIYRLSERFFNLWLLMTQGGPAQKQQVKYLTIFLESWYDRDELKKVYQQFHEKLTKGTLKPEYAASMTKALSHSRYITIEERDNLLESIQTVYEIKPEWLNELPEKSSTIFKKVEQLFEEENFEEALELIKSIEQEDGQKSFFLGYCYYRLNSFDKAEISYLKAAKDQNKEAMFNLGILYVEQRQVQKAEDIFMKSLNLGYDSALINLGVLYAEQGRVKEAEKYLLKAANNKQVGGMYNLGVLYNFEKDFKKAEKWYLKSAKIGHKEAIFNLAVLYYEQQKIGKAEEWYLEAIKYDNLDALVNLGLIYEDQHNKEEAKELYLKAASLGSPEGMNNLGLILEEEKSFDDAEKWYLKSSNLNFPEASRNLALLYENKGKIHEALAFHSKAIDDGDLDAMILKSLLLYEKNLYPDEAFLLIDKYIKQAPEDKAAKSLGVIISLWSGEIDFFTKENRTTLDELINEHEQYLYTFLGQLIIHKQSNLVRSWFADEEVGSLLKNKLQPLYFGLLKIENKEEDVILKTPPELEEAINDVIDQIKERQRFYYKN